MVKHCICGTNNNAEPTGSNPLRPEVFSLRNFKNCNYKCSGHNFISVEFPQLTWLTSFDELWLTIDTVDPVMVTVVREATSVALDIYILKAKSHLKPSHFTGTIIADVVIRVLNKTSDEYWFLLKMNTTVEGDNVENMGGVRPGIMDYFLVKLKVASR